MRHEPFTVALLAIALLAAPVALAGHDPTHGRLPHGVSDRPLDVRAVDISTPHPYQLGLTYSWSLYVEGADTLSLHFERYELNGYEDWTGACEGSELRIRDGDTGVLLDRFCGWSPDEDFWTPDYPASKLSIELETGGWESAYGFDVYEAAVNAARPVAAVPYSSTPEASLHPGAGAQADPFSPGSSAASAGGHGSAGWGAYGVMLQALLEYGRFWQCGGLSCEEIDGAAFGGALDAGTGADQWRVAYGAHATRDAGAPGGHRVSPPTVECSRNGEAC